MKLRKCNIKDLGTVLTGNTPPTSQRKYYGDLYPLIKPTDMKIDTRYIGDTEESLSEEGYKLFQRRLLPRDTTCVVTIGTIGKLCLTKEPSFCNQAVNSIIVNRELYDPLYIFYLMKTSIPKVKFLSSGTASGRENVSKTAFENIEIQVHELPTQMKIAGILSAYDDLIENNTRRIKILEEMAQTLYHEWFVKFRFPGHEHTKMVDSELGLIPEGCEVRKLGDVAKVISGFAFKSKDFQDEGIPVIKIKNIRNGTVDISDIQCVDSSFLSLNSKYHIKRGDLLISLTGSHLTQPNSVVGRVAIYSQSKKVCLLNQRAGKIFITNQEKCKISYLFYFLSSEDKRRSIALMASGAASQANISPTQVESLDLLIPKTDILNLFHQIIYPIFEKISNLEIKNSTLRQTRDLLLPKLISGEIDVERLEITTEYIAA